jgi:hypothetical protein
MQLNNLFFLISGAGTAFGQFCEHEWDGQFAGHDVDGVPYMQAFMENAAPPPLDIQPLIVTGPWSNRVDLIFLGDGCTCR